MTGQLPFDPLTPAALSKLAAEEREAFQAAAESVALDVLPSFSEVAVLVTAVHRLVTEEARAGEKLAAIHEAVVTRFLGSYGNSSLITFKVAIDLASSVRKILAGSGERVIAAETARAEAAEAKLAAIEVQCRGLLEHAASVNVPPSRTHLSVVHILAIISGEAGNG